MILLLYVPASRSDILSPNSKRGWKNYLSQNPHHYIGLIDFACQKYIMYCAPEKFHLCLRLCVFMHLFFYIERSVCFCRAHLLFVPVVGL